MHSLYSTVMLLSRKGTSKNEWNGSCMSEYVSPVLYNQYQHQQQYHYHHQHYNWMNRLHRSSVWLFFKKSCKNDVDKRSKCKWFVMAHNYFTWPFFYMPRSKSGRMSTNQTKRWNHNGINSSSIAKAMMVATVKMTPAQSRQKLNTNPLQLWHIGISQPKGK